MLFWIVAIAMTLISVLVLVWPLLRPAHAVESDRKQDLEIYRDQLAEVDKDVARGVLSPDEAKRTRTEVSRRLLDADADLAEVAPKSGQVEHKLLNRSVAALIAVAVLGGGFGLYREIGADGTADLPLAERRADIAAAQAARPSQATVEAKVGNATSMADAAGQSYRDLVQKLRETAAKRPNSLRGQQLLSRHEARLGNFAAARTAQQRVVALKGDKATAKDYGDLAELMIIAAGGYVSPEAEHALGEAIDRDPTDSRVRYYSGLDLAQNGRARLAFRIWSDLLVKGPADAPWIGPIKAQIGDVARMAGIQQPLPGPSQDQINSAATLTPENQQQMVQSMVKRLSDRLATEGGSAAEWARLITAYGVLKQPDKARATWTSAKAKFTSDPAALASLAAAATKAGLTK